MTLPQNRRALLEAVIASVEDAPAATTMREGA
jgi:hypothetical protein